MKLSILMLSVCLMAVALIAKAKPISSDEACSITCYEKTPSCYVTKDSSGCLVITNKKPKCSKGQCICELKGCDKKTTY